MGQQNQGYSLVSMTNGDVYYIEKAAARELLALIESGELQAFFVTRTRNGDEVAISIGKVSSIVVKDGQNA